MTINELRPGTKVDGLSKAGAVLIEAVNEHGPDSISVIFTNLDGGLGRQLLTRRDIEQLSEVKTAILPPLDADTNEFKLAAESLRIRLGFLYDPLLAVNSSVVEPLPHQIAAVYEHMLPRKPLRFLLADDPGAGKTIMAGLFIKELILRADVERCLIVVPGNLSEQWQDELKEKFELVFEIMTNDKLKSAASGNWLAEHDLVIARLDKLSRDEDLRPILKNTEWDLVIFDEAHKLSASRFGHEIKRTQRFDLARDISPLTRHLLLMTATPHNGKEEDFQLFLSLLDGDRFEGSVRDTAQPTDTSDLMRRLTKEQLRRFDGTPLFPPRFAYSVGYDLSERETDLYEQVTTYVREEFNRADRLDEKRKGNVGFALTVLQRRLASSPAAIHRSLERRRIRLEEQLKDLQAGRNGESSHHNETYADWLSREDLEDLEDAPDAEFEEAEETVMLRASTAQTIEELAAEIKTLKRLESLAFDVVRSGEDRKWTELSRLISEEELMYDANKARRKLVIFTEHRDTLNYLNKRISDMLGDSQTVVTISGGMQRELRKAAETRFKQDPKTHILVATDAAGEGINLQRAHLMINYDLPWNPNRLEQRFGRIHRIGQTENCHLWNLLANETREGQVFQRLLEKLKVESKALGGRVFDILGTVFEGTSLRDLLIRAIRDDGTAQTAIPDAVMDDLDRDTAHERLKSLMEQTALAFDTLDSETVQRMRTEMERARLRRLQPYYIQTYFHEAFTNLSGTLRRREKNRYEIRNVPTGLRRRDRVTGHGPPLLPRYERITFHPEHVSAEDGRTADLITPGHPLLTTVIDMTLEKYRRHLRTGTIMIDRTDSESNQLRAMVVLEHSILSGFVGGATPQQTVGRRLMTVWIYCDGSIEQAIDAPWLDLDVPSDSEKTRARQFIDETWTSISVEDRAVGYAASEIAPDHFAEISAFRTSRIQKTRSEVMQRLTQEIAYWDHRAEELRLQEKAGKMNNRINAENAARHRDNLQARLTERMRSLEEEESLSSQVPVLLSVAMVVPESAVAPAAEASEADGASPYESLSYEARRRIELIAMEAVMNAERELGNAPRDVSAENLGYDIESFTPAGNLRFLEVKGRVSLADNVTVTHNEQKYGFNTPEQYALVICLVEESGTVDGPHYVFAPFDREPAWTENSTNHSIEKLLSRNQG